MADMQLTPAGATDLSRYPADKFQVLARPEDLAVSSPLVRVDIAVVRIDARDVRAGGETHNLGGGQLTPARSAVDKIGDAAGITFDETRCETRREGERVWVAKAVGRRRLPDGTWRTVAAEYELDVDVREQEIRTREQNESKVQREVLQLQKFGRQRADTGARLRVIRALAGIKTGFASGELERPFVMARVSVNTEAMMERPGDAAGADRADARCRRRGVRAAGAAQRNAGARAASRRCSRRPAARQRGGARRGGDPV